MQIGLMKSAHGVEIEVRGQSSSAKMFKGPCDWTILNAEPTVIVFYLERYEEEKVLWERRHSLTKMGRNYVSYSGTRVDIDCQAKKSSIIIIRRLALETNPLQWIESEKKLTAISKRRSDGQMWASKTKTCIANVAWYRVDTCQLSHISFLSQCLSL